MNIVWIKKAQHHLTRIEYFLRENIQLEENTILDIIDKLNRAPKKLLQFPRMGQLTDIVEGKEVRRLLVKDYKIYYKVEGDTIVVLSVLHAKEDIEGIVVE